MSLFRLVSTLPLSCQEVAWAGLNLAFDPTRNSQDYTKNLDIFTATVESDEKNFKPLGSKIGEYARRKKKEDIPAAMGKGKAKTVETNGKGTGKNVWENCEISDDDAIVYEAYQVGAAKRV